MTTGSYRLEKSLWTDVDFDKMGWHDCYIYALGVAGPSELVLDIDYIFKWVDPPDGKSSIRFWIAPCTLVFENVGEFQLEYSMGVGWFPFQIFDIQRSNPQRPRNAEYINRDTEYDWEIDLINGSITFQSVGYKQFVRQEPVLVDEQRLGLERRNGISFDRRSIATSD